MPDAAPQVYSKITADQVFRMTPGGRKRLTSFAVAAMRSDFSNGMKKDEIREKYGCGVNTVYSVLKGMSHRNRADGIAPEFMNEVDKLKREEMLDAFKGENIDIKFLASKLRGLAASEDERIVLGAVKEIGLLMGIRAPERVTGDTKVQVNNVENQTPVTFLPENSRFFKKEPE